MTVRVGDRTGSEHVQMWLEDAASHEVAGDKFEVSLGGPQHIIMPQGGTTGTAGTTVIIIHVHR